MRVLVIGGAGMAGHAMVDELAGEVDVWTTVRAPLRAPLPLPADRVLYGVDCAHFESVVDACHRVRPDAVLNCVGIVKQRSGSAVGMLEVNAVFPHRLLELAAELRFRVIHLSTDCVFSGRAGNYRETDIADPIDLYGISKLAGELEAPGLTLRTSIIGLELDHFTSLIEWALREEGQIRGFTKAIYSGITTLELARLVRMLLTDHPELDGLWHVASEPISKFDLLQRLFAALESEQDVVPDDTLACDRSLNASRFEAAVGYRAPPWNEMIAELVEAIRIRERTA